MSLELPKSAVVVFGRLAKEGPMSPKEICSKLELPSRTVSFALRKLLRRKLCRKTPNLHDMRQPLYHADLERARRMIMDHGAASVVAIQLMQFVRM